MTEPTGIANSCECDSLRRTLRVFVHWFCVCVHCALSNLLQLRGLVSVVTTILPALQHRIAPKYHCSSVFSRMF